MQCVIITAACSVGGTEVITSVYCYVKPLLVFYVVNQEELFRAGNVLY